MRQIGRGRIQNVVIKRGPNKGRSIKAYVYPNGSYTPVKAQNAGARLNNPGGSSRNSNRSSGPRMTNLTPLRTTAPRARGGKKQKVLSAAARKRRTARLKLGIKLGPHGNVTKKNTRVVKALRQSGLLPGRKKGKKTGTAAVKKAAKRAGIGPIPRPKPAQASKVPGRPLMKTKAPKKAKVRKPRRAKTTAVHRTKRRKRR